MTYHQTVTLKNGTECLLRNATASDGQAVLDNFLLTHGETDFLLTYPDENTFDAKQESEYLKAKAESDSEIEIVAVVDGAIVATAGIEAVGKNCKVRHRVQFGISVAEKFWGLGIGRALTAACIECAKNAGYTQIELDVVGDNRRARSMYEAFGFLEYGRNPKGFCSRTAGFQEIVYMRLEL